MTGDLLPGSLPGQTNIPSGRYDSPGLIDRHFSPVPVYSLRSSHSAKTAPGAFLRYSLSAVVVPEMGKMILPEETQIDDTLSAKRNLIDSEKRFSQPTTPAPLLLKPSPAAGEISRRGRP